MDTDLNVPLALPGAGTSGPRDTALIRRQRASLRQLLVNGLTDDDLCTAMNSEFGMSEDDVMALKEVVQRKLISESEERKDAKKAMAEQRIHRHIVAAAKKSQFGAVAALEATLAKVQGTESPTEQRVQIDQRVVTATLSVLGSMSQQEVEALIESELDASARALPAGAPTQLPRVVRQRVMG